MRKLNIVLQSFSGYISIIIFSFLLLLIGIASSGNGIEAVRIMMKVPYGDKITHFFLIGSLSFFLNYFLFGKRFQAGRFSLTLANVILIAFFTVEEFSQAFIPYRNFEIIDMICNYAGIFIFSLIAIYIRKGGKQKVKIF